MDPKLGLCMETKFKRVVCSWTLQRQMLSPKEKVIKAVHRQ